MHRTTPLSWILVLLLSTTYACHNNPAGEISIVPFPDQLEFEKGSVKFGPSLQVSFPGSMEKQAALFSEQVIRLTGISDVSQADGSSALLFEIDSSSGKPGSYRIQLSSSQSLVTAADETGIFYACQTLIQILTQYSSGEGSINIPALSISDSPAFSWRGMHLDVSRHFFPPEFIKKYIDLLAFYKMNVFHWHLTDDQGWRIEIKKYPELTAAGAFREDTRDLPWSYDQHPVQEGRPVYGGFYTQEEVKEIVQYAADRFVTIVPEIELPGHSWAALYVFPELSCTGKPFFKDPAIPFEFTDPFCAGNEGTFTFFENVLDEVIALFPSEYIHIGGDEAKKTPWEHCASCQQRMRTEGLQDVEELQSYFVNRIGKYVSSKGRSIIGWDEILEGGLAENAAVMSWRGEAGGIAAAKEHHPVVMTPGEYTYLNSNQDLTMSENTRVIALETCYNYSPVPTDLTEIEKTYILGIQACLWTENVQTPEKAEFQILPRLLAIAETGWTKTGNKNYEAFLRRLEKQFEMLDRMGYNYFIEAPQGLRPENSFINEAVLELNNPLGFGEIYYAIDDEPLKNEGLQYKEAVKLSGKASIHAVTRLNSGKQSRTVSGTYIKVDPVAGEHGDFNPGLILDYAEGEIQSLENFSSLKHIRTDTVGLPLIPAFVREDFYGLEFKGFIKIEENGVYTFITNSDDGTRLYLHDSLLVDNDGIHGPVRVSGQVALAEGYHPFRLQFFEGNYGQVLQVSVFMGDQEIIPVFGWQGK